MSQEKPETKRARANDTMNEVGLSKELMKCGASLHKKKNVILANFKSEPEKVLAVHHAKFGGVGVKLFLLPKEMDENVTPTYSDSGELIGITKDGVSLGPTYMKTVVMSWNSYKKNDAWMAYIGEDNKVVCSFPRVRAVEVEVVVGIKGKKTQIKAWRTTVLASSSVHYAFPTTIMGFLELNCVGPEDFVRVAMSVESAVVAGGFVQIDAAAYGDIEELAAKCVDTTLFKEARDLSGLIMGLVQKNASVDDKISAFMKTPSVAFATACKFFQVQAATLTNLTTKSDVMAVSLKDLDDDDNVLMGRVTINVDYWNKLTDFDSFTVYKEAGNLAIKKKGKQQSTAQKFDVMKAGYVKAIHKAICDTNTKVIPSKSKPITEVIETLDDNLFD